MKKEIKKQVLATDIIKTNPSEWIQVEEPQESKIGDLQVRFAHKNGRYFCYNNYDYDTKKIKSRFFCDETEGRENYKPLRRVAYRADGTISSIRIYKGGKQYTYCFQKDGKKSFKIIVE
jgi:hypothetical protein